MVSFVNSLRNRHAAGLLGIVDDLRVAFSERRAELERGKRDRMDVDRKLIKWGYIHRSFDEIQNGFQASGRKMRLILISILSGLTLIKFVSFFFIQNEQSHLFWLLGDFTGYLGLPRKMVLVYLLMYSTPSFTYMVGYLIKSVKGDYRWLESRKMLAGYCGPSHVGLNEISATRFASFVRALDSIGEINAQAGGIFTAGLCIAYGIINWPVNVWIIIFWGGFWLVVTDYPFYKMGIFFLQAFALFIEDCFYLWLRFGAINTECESMIRRRQLADSKFNHADDWQRLCAALESHRDACNRLIIMNDHWNIMLFFSLGLCIMSVSYMLVLLLYLNLEPVTMFIGILCVIAVYSTSSSLLLAASHGGRMVYKSMRNLVKLSIIMSPKPPKVAWQIITSLERMNDIQLRFTCLSFFSIDYIMFITVST